MVARSGAERSVAIRGGIVAGIIAGMIASIYALVTSLIAGNDPWLGAKIAAAPFVGARAYAAGFDAVPVIVGMLCHFAVSISWSVLFALLVYGLTPRATILAGVPFGIVVWLVMFYIVLPLIGLSGVVEQTPVSGAVLEHLLFGLSLGVAFAPFQSRVPVSVHRDLDEMHPIH